MVQVFDVPHNIGIAGEIRHRSADIEQLFAQLFRSSHRTRLCGGASEPLYQPAAGPAAEHTIFYRADYFASALHEIAHWCIAGSERRQLVDYGYWYAPDGRAAQQQREFERAELRPQALEKLFSYACDYPFQPSIDNLDAPATHRREFAHGIQAQLLDYCDTGLPARAASFYRALAQFYGNEAAALEQIRGRCEVSSS